MIRRATRNGRNWLALPVQLCSTSPCHAEDATSSRAGKESSSYGSDDRRYRTQGQRHQDDRLHGVTWHRSCRPRDAGPHPPARRDVRLQPLPLPPTRNPCAPSRSALSPSFPERAPPASSKPPSRRGCRPPCPSPAPPASGSSSPRLRLLGRSSMCDSSFLHHRRRKPSCSCDEPATHLPTHRIRYPTSTTPCRVPAWIGIPTTRSVRDTATGCACRKVERTR